jgi:hypothetical protein
VRVYQPVDLVVSRGADPAPRRWTAENKGLKTWALNTPARVGRTKATVALAGKLVRIMWSVWTRYDAFNTDRALRFAA